MYRGVRINLAGHYANRGVYAGLFRMEDSSTGAEILAWCVDLYNNLRSNALYDVSSFSATGFSTAVKENVARLFTGFYADIDTRDEAAAYQIALWELVTETDGSMNLGSGIFSVASASTSVLGLANSYLSGLSGFGTNGYNLTFFDSQNNSSQNLVSVSPVPLPAAGGLLLAGLAGIAALRRRRKS